MLAAIYARKSTEQTGVADEQKSVARQIENARALMSTEEAAGWAQWMNGEIESGFREV